MSQIDYNNLAASLSPEVLALLAASYGKKSPDEVVSRMVTRHVGKTAKPSKLATIKAQASDQASPAVTEEKKPPMTVIDLPAVGSHNARSFLIAMRRATTRDESIKAIAGYCGFDRHGDYGSQDLAARMKAQRELRGCVAAPTPAHSVRPTLTGYVSGLPDPQRARIADLMGRASLATEAIAEHEQAAKAHLDLGDQTSAHYEAQLALVEKGRLAQINADLTTLGVK